MKVKKAAYVLLGLISLGVGGIGAVVPLLPSFPFLMLALFCFARSSKRLHDWFIHTRMYKKNLESYVQGKGMSRSAKIRIMIMVTVVMSIGFVWMWIKGIYIPCVILLFVWVFHILYFIFKIKTIPEVS